MKDTITTARDIRLHLASLLDQLSQIQNTERWEQVTTHNPQLKDQFQIAQDAMDTLWYSWRQTTGQATTDI